MSTSREHALAHAPPIETAWQWALCPECYATFPLTELSAAELESAVAIRRRRENARDAFLDKVERLSRRERAVMTSIARGVMPADVAKQLNINVKTVNTYRERVQEKLGLRSNAEIAVACHKAGLLE